MCCSHKKRGGETFFYHKFPLLIKFCSFHSDHRHRSCTRSHTHARTHAHIALWFHISCAIFFLFFKAWIQHGGGEGAGSEEGNTWRRRTAMAWSCTWRRGLILTTLFSLVHSRTHWIVKVSCSEASFYPVVLSPWQQRGRGGRWQGTGLQQQQVTGSDHDVGYSTFRGRKKKKALF